METGRRGEHGFNNKEWVVHYLLLKSTLIMVLRKLDYLRFFELWMSCSPTINNTLDNFETSRTLPSLGVLYFVNDRQVD